MSCHMIWHLPGGAIHSQVDYILTPRWFNSSINMAKTWCYLEAENGKWSWSSFDIHQTKIEENV